MEYKFGEPLKSSLITIDNNVITAKDFREKTLFTTYINAIEAIVLKLPTETENGIVSFNVTNRNEIGSNTIIFTKDQSEEMEEMLKQFNSDLIKVIDEEPSFDSATEPKAEE